jgi:hypothetical protein
LKRSAPEQRSSAFRLRKVGREYRLDDGRHDTLADAEWWLDFLTVTRPMQLRVESGCAKMAIAPSTFLSRKARTLPRRWLMSRDPAEWSM